MNLENLRFLSAINIAGISEIQKSPNKALKDITAVLKGSDIVGFYISIEKMGELLKELDCIIGKASNIEECGTSPHIGIEKFI